MINDKNLFNKSLNSNLYRFNAIIVFVDNQNSDVAYIKKIYLKKCKQQLEIINKNKKEMFIVDYYKPSLKLKDDFPIFFFVSGIHRNIYCKNCSLKRDVMEIILNTILNI
jgi:hypothetical protein